MIDQAKQGTLEPGWRFTDPEIVNAHERMSVLGIRTLAKHLLPKLDGLLGRLTAPAASFLDVGTGVGFAAIAMCRLYPNLHVVGIDVPEISLAEARRNVADARLESREWDTSVFHQTLKCGIQASATLT